MSNLMLWSQGQRGQCFLLDCLNKNELDNLSQVSKDLKNLVYKFFNHCVDRSKEVTQWKPIALLYPSLQMDVQRKCDDHNYGAITLKVTAFLIQTIKDTFIQVPGSDIDNISPKALLQSMPLYFNLIKNTQEKYRVLKMLNANANLMQILLAFWSFSNENKLIFINYASQHGNTEILQILLHLWPISNEERGQALCKAVQNRHPNNVRLLLDSGPISDEIKDECIDSAIESREILEIFIPLGISEAKRVKYITKAIRCNLIDIAYRLISLETLSNEMRGNCVIAAAHYGHLELVTALLDLGPIFKRQTRIAIAHAREKGYDDIIKILTRPISTCVMS